MVELGPEYRVHKYWQNLQLSSGVLFTDEPVSAVQKPLPYLVIYVEDCLGDGFCKLAVLIEELSVVVITLCLKP